MIMDKVLLKRLLDVAQGSAPADTVIRNGKLVNVFTDSVEDNVAIIIKDGRVVSIEEDKRKTSFAGAKEIDAEGAYLCPGFIDAHTHLDSMFPFHEFVPFSLRGGTTTIISECAMAAGACGIKGVESFVESTKGYPMRCYFVAPPMTPPFPKLESAAPFTLKEFSTLLKREDFLGIGEAYWTRAVEGDNRILAQAALAQSLNKCLDGHSSGARGKRLTEYALTGITSCHESVSLSEAMEKLRLGMYVMIREGFVRQELPELSKLKDMKVDKRRIMMVSDVFDAPMLWNEGYLDSVVKKAIEFGFSPMDAIKMVTINPADYHHLRNLGAIAPLRFADILFLRNLEDVTIEKVMVNGEVVVAGKKFVKDIKPFVYPKEMTHTITVDKFEENDFRIKARTGANRIRVLHVANPTITKELVVEARVKDGYVEKDLENDVVPIAVINRRQGKGMGKGFIKGTGIKEGAVATTLIWDTCNILAIGSSEAEMRDAVNRLIDIQGGTVIIKNGEVIYEFPMPVFGLIPLMTMKESMEKTKGLDEKMRSIGAYLEKPFLTIQTIPFTGLPFLRITDRGLADIKNKRMVPIFL
jgi:adenine deaminase